MIKRIGLALGSGADRGFAHIGVIKTLIENEIQISCITGSSMGALVGAYFALYGNVTELEALALTFSPARLISLLDLTFPTTAIIRGKKIRKFLIESLFHEATFADTKIPIAISATALEDGAPYIFSKGLLADAVLASGTIPGILPPFEVDGLHLIDGGLANAVPIDLLDQLGAEVRIGVDLYSYAPLPTTKFDTKEVIARTYRLYISKLSELQRQMSDPRTLILSPRTDEGIETLIFTRAKPNIEAGINETQKKIAEIKQLAGITRI